MTYFQEIDFYPGTNWHQVTETLFWRPYKHWGSGVWAGEGLEMRLYDPQRPEKGGDRSGCRTKIAGIWMTNSPSVVEARCYRTGNHDISAVFSFPMDIGAEDHYFWEIYPGRYGRDIERFRTEEEMETALKELEQCLFSC